MLTNRFLFLMIGLVAAPLLHAQVLIEPTAFTTAEGGTPVDYFVVLQSPPNPGETVTISPASQDVTEGTVSGAVVFTARDYDRPQAITLTPGASGDGNDGDVSYSITHAVASTGGVYTSASAPPVSVTNLNVNGAQTLFAEPGVLQVTEGAIGAPLTLTTTAAPAAPITVQVSTPSSEVTLSTGSVVLDAGNGYSASLYVTAVNDDVLDGMVAFNLSLTASSSDGVYNGFDFDVPGLAFDNDGPALFEVAGNVAIAGDADIEGEVRCPAGTHRAGAWCIGPQRGPAAYNAAMAACWDQDLMLCPLQALLACDVVEPEGADCTAFTDSPTLGDWAWCEEQPTANDVSAFVGGEARIFASTGNNTGNEVDFSAKTSSRAYFCCLPRR